MRRLLFFMMTTANGLYERQRWDVGWHNVDDEFESFAVDQLNSVDTLLFGRVTYEGMASFWPTPEAEASDPVVAKQMNSLPKLVFSTSLESADWNNSRLIKDDPAAAVARLKQEGGGDAIVLASSDLALTLAAHDLIDEYRLMVNPLFLGAGKPVLQGLRQDLELQLLAVRTFANGNVLLTYRPKRGTQGARVT
jgi:dihydrofolate reductase